MLLDVRQVVEEEIGATYKMAGALSHAFFLQASELHTTRSGPTCLHSNYPSSLSVNEVRIINSHHAYVLGIIQT